MRTKQEIKQAVAILCHKSDCLSLVQAEVLRGNMTEQQVFQKYVMETKPYSLPPAMLPGSLPDI